MGAVGVVGCLGCWDGVVGVFLGGLCGFWCFFGMLVLVFVVLGGCGRYVF